MGIPEQLRSQVLVVSEAEQSPEGLVKAQAEVTQFEDFSGISASRLLLEEGPQIMLFHQRMQLFDPLEAPARRPLPEPDIPAALAGAPEPGGRVRKVKLFQKF